MPTMASPSSSRPSSRDQGDAAQGDDQRAGHDRQPAAQGEEQQPGCRRRRPWSAGPRHRGSAPGPRPSRRSCRRPSRPRTAPAAGRSMIVRASPMMKPLSTGSEMNAPGTRGGARPRRARRCRWPGPAPSSARANCAARSASPRRRPRRRQGRGRRHRRHHEVAGAARAARTAPGRVRRRTGRRPAGTPAMVA